MVMFMQNRRFSGCYVANLSYKFSLTKDMYSRLHVCLNIVFCSSLPTMQVKGITMLL